MLLLPIQIPPSVLRRSASQELSTFQRQDAKTPRRKEQHVFLASLRLCVEKEADLNPSESVHPSSSLFRPVRHAVVANPNPSLSPSPFGQSGAVHFSTPRRQDAKAQGTARLFSVFASLRLCVEKVIDQTPSGPGMHPNRSRVLPASR